MLWANSPPYGWAEPLDCGQHTRLHFVELCSRHAFRMHQHIRHTQIQLQYTEVHNLHRKLVVFVCTWHAQKEPLRVGVTGVTACWPSWRIAALKHSRAQKHSNKGFWMLEGYLKYLVDFPIGQCSRVIKKIPVCRQKVIGSNSPYCHLRTQCKYLIM